MTHYENDDFESFARAVEAASTHAHLKPLLAEKKNPATPVLGPRVMKFYQQNPRTESFYSSGLKLRDGDVVLVGDPAYREDLDKIENPGDEWMAKKWNRWCLIEEVEIYTDAGQRRVSFIGDYDDGTKHKFDVSVRVPWLVKI